jgi:hypothetical protein
MSRFDDRLDVLATSATAWFTATTEVVRLKPEQRRENCDE